MLTPRNAIRHVAAGILTGLLAWSFSCTAGTGAASPGEQSAPAGKDMSSVETGSAPGPGGAEDTAVADYRAGFQRRTGKALSSGVAE